MRKAELRSRADVEHDVEQGGEDARSSGTSPTRRPSVPFLAQEPLCLLFYGLHKIGQTIPNLSPIDVLSELSSVRCRCVVPDCILTTYERM